MRRTNLDTIYCITLEMAAALAESNVPKFSELLERRQSMLEDLKETSTDNISSARNVLESICEVDRTIELRLAELESASQKQIDMARELRNAAGQYAAIRPDRHILNSGLVG